MGLNETQALLDRAAGGDEGAEGDLLERLRPRLVLWSAARMSASLRARVEPEDLAQEILLAVHRALPRYRPPKSGTFLPWLFTIAENRVRDAGKHFSAKKRQVVAAAAVTQTSPSQAYVRKEDVDRLRRVIDGLPEAQREVVRLRRLEDRTDEEVAAAMGRSENAIRILYCRALKSLRDAMVEAT